MVLKELEKNPKIITSNAIYTHTSLNMWTADLCVCVSVCVCRGGGGGVGEEGGADVLNLSDSCKVLLPMKASGL